MKKHLFYLGTALLFLSSCSKDSENASIPQVGTNKMLATNDNSDYNRYIIKFEEDALKLPDNRKNLSKDQLRLSLADFFNDINLNPANVVHWYKNVYPGIATPLTQTQLSAVLEHPLVSLVSADEKITLDSFIEESPRINEKAQNTPWGINRVGSADATGKTAWVLDTGVDLDHPDLNVDLLRSQSFASGDGTLLSNGGDDNHGHGTHVAGTIAAKDNNIGVVGVAANATVVSVKVLGGNGSGLITDVIAGIDYVAGLSLPGDVANMSLSGGANSLVDLAVQSASLSGTWYVMAAGNDRRDANHNSPARANGPFLVTVSAFRSGDILAGFSNYGNPPIEYAAPGQSVYSTYRNGGYRTLSGTSMAAPHVAGLYLHHNGAPNTDGVISGDRDNTPDPIAIL